MLKAAKIPRRRRNMIKQQKGARKKKTIKGPTKKVCMLKKEIKLFVLSVPL